MRKKTLLQSILYLFQLADDVSAANSELEQALSIALTTAPDYALRNAMSPRGELDRQVAVETLAARECA